MDPIPGLEARVSSLEASLRRSRLVAGALAFAVVLTGAVAMAPQEPNELTSARLVLTGAPDSSAVVLIAGPESSLVIRTPSGEEVVTIGGPAARRAR